MIKLLFPGLYTEAHQTEDKGRVLLELFREEGIDCYSEGTSARHVDAVFCGSFMKNQYLKTYVTDNQLHRMKVFHYSWDIYPWQLEGKEAPYPYWTRWWKEYVEDLKHCTEVFVPSKCSVDRVQEFCNRDATVILAPAHTFDEPTWKGDYVLDCMRKYPDPNRNAVYESCKRLGIPCVETRNRLAWDEYKRTVAGCRFMVSAQYEASTGGLSLLEGYALGKPVLLSNSPRHGGKDYFGDRASTFTWGEPASLDNMIQNLWEFTGKFPNWQPPQCRSWVEENYNDRIFVKQIADRIKSQL